MERKQFPRSAFSLAVRPALFVSDIDGKTYFSTGGGSVTLGKFQGWVIGITCQHVLKEYENHQFLINENLRGGTATGPVAFLRVGGEGDDIAGTEIEDLVICVWENLLQRFPMEELVDFDAVVESEEFDKIVAVGFPKNDITLSESSAEAFCLELHTEDIGQYGHDDSLRIAGGRLKDDDLLSVTGFSGGLAYDLTKAGPAGIIVRGGVSGGALRLYFVPITKVLGALQRQWYRIEERLDALGVSLS